MTVRGTTPTDAQVITRYTHIRHGGEMRPIIEQAHYYVDDTWVTYADHAQALARAFHEGVIAGITLVTQHVESCHGATREALDRVLATAKEQQAQGEGTPACSNVIVKGNLEGGDSGGGP